MNVEAVMKALKVKYKRPGLFSDEGLDTPTGIKSGSMEFDAATCVGGWPKGRVIEVFGENSSGKTSWALHVLKNDFEQFPDDERPGMIVDAEHTITKKLVKDMGVPMDRMIFCKPESCEEALQIIIDANASGMVRFILLDSVDALQSEKTLSGAIEDVDMQGIAKMMGKALRQICKSAEKNNVTNVFVNQLRDSLNPYGPKKVTPGGKALAFYATARIEMKKGKPSKAIPNAFVATSILRKNKCGPECLKEIEFDFVYGKGPDEVLGTVNYAKTVGLVSLRGSAAYFCFSEVERKLVMDGTGLQGLRQYLESKPDEYEKLKTECVKIFTKREMDATNPVVEDTPPEE